MKVSFFNRAIALVVMSGFALSASASTLDATFTTINPTCFGSSNGTIFTTPTGGVPPYTYSWDNGKTTRNINLLSANDYYLTLTDSVSDQVVLGPVTLTQPSAVTMSVATTSTSATITADGGTPGYTYNRTGALTFQPNNVFSGLTPGGTYIFKTKDNQGCQKSVIKKLPLAMIPPVNHL